VVGSNNVEEGYKDYDIWVTHASGGWGEVLFI